MKICPKCKQTKPTEEFNRKKGGYNPYCRLCNSEYLKQHYLANKAQYKHRNKQTEEKVRNYIRDAKRVPCADCGSEYPHYVMDFDHLPGHTKSFDISNSWVAKGFEQIKAEVKKCEVICSNCHRERTWKRSRSKDQDQEAEVAEM